jgi:hypothetical protein
VHADGSILLLLLLLQEGDYTIQTCALTLVRGMVNRRNLHDTVLHLMLTMRRAEQVNRRRLSARVPACPAKPKLRHPGGGS